MSIAEGKEIVVFLDYDGTLSPIVDDPDQAYMGDVMRAAVREVAYCFPTAIVSGRSKDKVYEFVKLRNVYYAGSHGMDISTPLGSSKFEDQKHQTRALDEKGNHVVHFHPAKEFLPTIQEIVKVLKENTTRIKGSMVEDNMFCVSVHYRRVKNEEDVGVLKEMVESIMKAYPDFYILEGKKVMEIRPNVNWDKGHALMYLLDTLGFDNFNDVFPMYLGDDRTDEDAFKVIRHIGRGFPIIVSTIAKETEASYSLRDPADVLTFLIRLAKWKNNLLHKTSEGGSVDMEAMVVMMAIAIAVVAAEVIIMATMLVMTMVTMAMWGAMAIAIVLEVMLAYCKVGKEEPIGSLKKSRDARVQGFGSERTCIVTAAQWLSHDGTAGGSYFVVATEVAGESLCHRDRNQHDGGAKGDSDLSF
ncbi:trehalose-phosphate phosphatase 3 [Spatholobus suberectus]|nr:trehalose-phosphate phosphatase 3 [Spatholobus suberectus]